MIKNKQSKLIGRFAALEHQGDPFGKDIEAIFEAISFDVLDGKIKTVEDLNKAAYGTKLSQLVFSRMHLKLNVIFADSKVAPIVILPNASAAVSVPAIFSGSAESEIDKMGIRNIDQKASVNMETATLSGEFTELRHDCVIDLFNFTNYNCGVNCIDTSHKHYSNQELTFLMLSEIERVFMWYDMTAKVSRVSRAILTASKVLARKDNKIERENIKKELESELDLDKDEASALVESSGGSASLRLYRVAVFSFKKCLDVNALRLSNEEKGGSFAFRFGYGRYSVFSDSNITLLALASVILAPALPLIIMSTLVIVAYGSMFIAAVAVFALPWVATYFVVKLIIDGIFGKSLDTSGLKDTYSSARKSIASMLSIKELSHHATINAVSNINFVDSIFKKAALSTALIEKSFSFFSDTYKQAVHSVEQEVGRLLFSPDVPADMLAEATAVPGIAKIAVEMIDVQQDDFLIKLEGIFTNIKMDLEKGLYESPIDLEKSVHRVDIEELVFERLGINLMIIFNTITPGAVDILPINNNHILLPELFHGGRWIEETIAATKIMDSDKGAINLAKAKLSGIFSKYKHPCFLNIYQFLGREVKTNGVIDYVNNVHLSPLCSLTSAEFTAILAHELGHIFTWYEMANRFSRTNQVIAEVSKVLMNKDKHKELSFVYREMSETFDMDQREIDALVSTNSVLIGSKLAMIALKDFTKTAGRIKYDDTSSEQLADQFATRFGYGIHLATGLSKLTKFYQPSPIAMALFDPTLMYLALSTLYGLALPATILITVPLLVMTIFANESDVNFKHYDTVRDRFGRVKHQMIDILKNRELDESVVKETISNIEFMEKLIKEAPADTSLLNRISRIMTQKGRTNAAEEEQEKLMETLIHSDLFVKSAELNT